MILGVTGTRLGVSKAQMDWFWREVIDYTTLHHGACVGADEFAHNAALVCGLTVVVHPPVSPKYRMEYDARATWLPAREYLDRNRDIVDASNTLIALPDGPERLESGTWATVRYAYSIHRPVIICYPGGMVRTK